MVLDPLWVEVERGHLVEVNPYRLVGLHHLADLITQSAVSGQIILLG